MMLLAWRMVFEMCLFLMIPRVGFIVTFSSNDPVYCATSLVG